ncbi:hypothetical protein Naga_100568g2 [Nannochloropsis gaditana]|uniref:Uncharacterized protein n=1 Tax=Nannochloropsis gaditana TaxID=72520 RepID=W7TX63_9STRA|nr:hypothetical protein Naga_100568g2 [Nannochloropsis gaditana]
MEKAGLVEPSLPGEEWLMECDEVLVTMSSCAGRRWEVFCALGIVRLRRWEFRIPMNGGNILSNIKRGNHF